MSLLFINNSQETFTPTASGALATIIWECCQVASRQGINPTVLTRRASIEPFKWPQTLFVDYPKMPAGALSTFVCRADRKLTGWRHYRQREYAARIIKTIRERQLQTTPMVLFNEPEMAVVLRSAFPRARIIHWFQNQQQCKERYRAQFGRAVDVVLGCSNFTSQWIETYYGLKPASVRTIYNGVDSDVFSPAAQVPDGPPVINFVGRTGIEKGPDLLLQAALKLAAGGMQFAVQMLGSNHWDRFDPDAYQQNLSRLADNLMARGIPVRRPGHIGRTALAGELRKAHIHVVPARWDEPFGMTTVEGMACGLATVASRTGGTPEIVGGCGVLFERDSVDGLADALHALLTEPSRRTDLANKARKRAAEFSWQRAWKSLCELSAA